MNSIRWIKEVNGVKYLCDKNFKFLLFGQPLIYEEQKYFSPPEHPSITIKGRLEITTSIRWLVSRLDYEKEDVKKYLNIRKDWCTKGAIREFNDNYYRIIKRLPY